MDVGEDAGCDLSDGRDDLLGVDGKSQPTVGQGEAEMLAKACLILDTENESALRSMCIEWDKRVKEIAAANGRDVVGIVEKYIWKSTGVPTSTRLQETCNVLGRR